MLVRIPRAKIVHPYTTLPLFRLFGLLRLQQFFQRSLRVFCDDEPLSINFRCFPGVGSCCNHDGKPAYAAVLRGVESYPE